MSFNSIKKLTSLNPSKKVSEIFNKVSKNRMVGKSFIFKNILTVGMLFITIVILTAFIIVFDISFKKNEYVVDRSYIKEGFGLLEKARKNILKKKCSDASDQQKMCLENDKTMCNKLDCCTWVNYNKHGVLKKPSCVSGSENGPSSKKKCDKKDKKCKLGFDEYYFKGTKYKI
tara:strand:+ start:1595 stop:2113 length:519 start_codon:yes stop_codon:yes gene_type:complete